MWEVNGICIMSGKSLKAFNPFLARTGGTRAKNDSSEVKLILYQENQKTFILKTCMTERTNHSC